VPGTFLVRHEIGVIVNGAIPDRSLGPLHLHHEPSVTISLAVAVLNCAMVLASDGCVLGL